MLLADSPNQDDREFQKARIEAARHRDARHLEAYFEGVKRLQSDYVPDIEIMVTRSTTTMNKMVFHNAEGVLRGVNRF